MRQENAGYLRPTALVGYWLIVLPGYEAGHD
jgi:hypothetical protein